MKLDEFKVDGKINFLKILLSLLSINFLIEITNNKSIKLKQLIPDVKLNDLIWSFFILAEMILMSFFAFWIENYLRKSSKKENNANKKSIIHICLKIANIILNVYLTSMISWFLINDFFVRCLSILIIINYFLKIYSFHIQLNDYNRDICSDMKEKETIDLFYKTKSETICINHFKHFLLQPHLVYRKLYKIKPKISWNYIIKKLLFTIIYFRIFVFIKNQLIIPILKDLVMIKKDYEFMVKYLRFVILISISWILLFQIFFVNFLNMLREYSGSKECKIYEDWWSSKNTDEFWRKWNIPFHNWISQNIYKKFLLMKFTSDQSKAISFIVSGFIHEYAFFLACKKFGGWIFLSMLSQIPLSFVTRYVELKIPGLGNYVFWILFCLIGQPLAVLLYFNNNFCKSF